MQASKAKYDSFSNASIGKKLPDIAKGVTTKLISGMANAFASGDISDAWWNINSNNGNMPKVTTHCDRKAAFNHAVIAIRPANAYANTATAENDNQKPAAIAVEMVVVTVDGGGGGGKQRRGGRHGRQ